MLLKLCNDPMGEFDACATISAMSEPYSNVVSIEAQVAGTETMTVASDHTDVHQSSAWAVEGVKLLQLFL